MPAAASPLRWEAGAGIDVGSYASAERRQNGAWFNQENGTIAGPSLSVAASWGAWRLDVASTIDAGTIDYVGQTQLGLPIASRTRLVETRTEVSPTVQVPGSPFFVGVSMLGRTIDRRIEPTPLSQALHEALTDVELGPTWGVRWSSPFGLQLMLEVSELFALHSNLDVDFEGAFDGGRLFPSSAETQRGTVAMSYPLFRGVDIAARWTDERFRPSASPAVPLTKNGASVGLYDYPGSVQGLWDARVGLTAAF